MKRPGSSLWNISTKRKDDDVDVDGRTACQRRVGDEGEFPVRAGRVMNLLEKPYPIVTRKTPSREFQTVRRQIGTLLEASIVIDTVHLRLQSFEPRSRIAAE